MIAALIFVVSFQTAPPPEVPSPGTEKLFSIDDYPEEAVRNNWQGAVTVQLNITKDGRARACRIIQSSGYPVLDIKTCEIILIRARFTPARNKYGQPMEDVYRVPAVRWQLEQGETGL